MLFQKNSGLKIIVATALALFVSVETFGFGCHSNPDGTRTCCGPILAGMRCCNFASDGGLLGCHNDIDFQSLLPRSLGPRSWQPESPSPIAASRNASFGKLAGTYFVSHPCDWELNIGATVTVSENIPKYNEDSIPASYPALSFQKDGERKPFLMLGMGTVRQRALGAAGSYSIGTYSDQGYSFEEVTQEQAGGSSIVTTLGWLKIHKTSAGMNIDWQNENENPGSCVLLP